MHTPLIAAAMGLPQVSSRLRISGYCRTPSTKARIAASLPSALARRAYSWPAVSSIVRSAPAAKPSLPDVNTAPLIASSLAILSTIRPSSPTTSLLITFIERPGMSQVTRATPSASVSKRKLVRFMVAGLRRGQTRSMIVAVPMPPPMHSVMSAAPLPVRSSSSSAVPRIIAPVAPSGWPMAIAPPLTLTLLGSTSNA